MAMLPSLLKNRSPRSGDGNGKSTVGGSQKRRNAAQPTSVTRLFKGFGTLPNKQKQRFPATPGTAVSSLCGNKDTACKVSEPPPTGRMFPLILVVTNMVITTFGKRPSDPMCATGQAGRLYIQTLKTDFQRCRRKSVFACWGSTPDPLNSPLPGLAARSEADR